MMGTSGIIALLITVAVLIAGGYYITTRNDDAHHSDTAVSGEIYPSAVVEKIANKEDIIILDVRTPEEYEEVHIENAVLLPVQVLSAQTLEEVGIGNDMKDKEIIVYCRSGARGQTAYNIMKSLGYTNVKNISGGMIHWEEDGNPYTESGAYQGVVPSSETTTVQSPTASPKLVMKSDFYDFGVIPQYGGVVEQTFPITNDGTETLIIGEITTSCGCTSANISRSSLEPGEEAILTVSFDPDFHEEPPNVFKRTVFIPTNDPTIPEKEVTIRVDIEEGI
tara:strand:- start:16676 stop:17512 length:837 start_codon:yes stop_codon:yes gene_type:complete